MGGTQREKSRGEAEAHLLFGSREGGWTGAGRARPAPPGGQGHLPTEADSDPASEEHWSAWARLSKGSVGRSTWCQT